MALSLNLHDITWGQHDMTCLGQILGNALLRDLVSGRKRFPSRSLTAQSIHIAWSQDVPTHHAEHSNLIEANNTAKGIIFHLR